MKILATTGLVLGLAFSMPVLADTHDVADQTKPNDLVGVQLKQSDGSKAPALMERQDAKKFHKATGIEAEVVGVDIKTEDQKDSDTKKMHDLDNKNMNQEENTL